MTSWSLASGISLVCLLLVAALASFGHLGGFLVRSPFRLLKIFFFFADFSHSCPFLGECLLPLSWLVLTDPSLLILRVPVFRSLAGGCATLPSDLLLVSFQQSTVADVVPCSVTSKALTRGTNLLDARGALCLYSLWWVVCE